MADLPRGHIATKQGEISAHGHHADLIAPTEYGSHQIRVVQIEGRNVGWDKTTGKCVGLVTVTGEGKFRIDDQHNLSPAFSGLGKVTAIDVNHPDYYANRNEPLMANGQPDPRGTAMGGYNPRR